MRRATVLAIGLMTATVAFAQSAGDSLSQGFINPPDSAKPRTWWHWTNGNVTETGITKDLEWMKRSGIGGFQLVDVAAGGGQTVEPKINFATPEWYHAVLHSAEEAKRLGLEMSIFSCAGWSEAGGPWVTPGMAMKKLVWSETERYRSSSVLGETRATALERRPRPRLSRGFAARCASLLRRLCRHRLPHTGRRALHGIDAPGNHHEQRANRWRTFA